MWLSHRPELPVRSSAAGTDHSPVAAPERTRSTRSHSQVRRVRTLASGMAASRVAVLLARGRILSTGSPSLERTLRAPAAGTVLSLDVRQLSRLRRRLRQARSAARGRTECGFRLIWRKPCAAASSTKTIC